MTESLTISELEEELLRLQKEIGKLSATALKLQHEIDRRKQVVLRRGVKE